MKGWHYDPHSGGQKISPAVRSKTEAIALAYSKTRPWYPKYQLRLRFRGQFCYLDGCEDGGKAFPLGRLRYFSENKWSLAFYTYSNERYEPCIFPTGEWCGTVEDAIRICEMYCLFA
jgi:hypothetical protein